jgi:hypothetical protein
LSLAGMVTAMVGGWYVFYNPDENQRPQAKSDMYV